MKRKILLPLLFALFALKGFSQMTIGASTAPNAASVLDLSNATTLGLLPPQVALTATNTAGPVTSPPTSLLVYNTATTGTSPYNVTPGYYYNAGTSASPNWVRFFAQNNSSSSAWTTTGNSGTTASTATIGNPVNNNFIGTTDTKDLVIASNNLERMRVTSSGSIGIGTITPSASAIVQMYSTTQGVSFPTMDSTHRDAIASPVTGLTIYDQTTGCLEFYVAGKWQPVGCGCTQKPAAPTSIAISPTGTICQNTSVSYSISDVSTATSYTWAYSGSIGTGGTYTGQGTTQINVNYGTSPTAGNWTVSATNACGTSATVSTAVSLTPVPATPGTITQSPSGTVCPGQTGITFSITAVTNATSYNWTLPGTATITAGSGTNSITVTWGTTAGSVTVTAVGCNGNSTGSSSLSVSLLPVPATPGTITASPANFCSGATVTYSITAVTNASSYTWTYPSDATYVSGQGTTSLTITEGTSTGTVTVTASDCSGTSTGSASITVSPGHGSQTFTYSSAGLQTFTVPGCVTSINVKIWGAGGGGGGYDIPFFGFIGGNGGSGAYMSGTVTVTAGSTLYIVVGQGGGTTATTSYGGGGAGGYSGATGSGGGRSAIQITSGVDVATAGGGGGGGFIYNNAYPYGGYGGNTDGGAGGYSRTTATGSAGQGGKTSTSAGGTGGTGSNANYNGTAGALVTQYQGGAGNGYNGADPGGGGGGGYYGGGGGAGGANTTYCGGGGGGSSYPSASTASFTLGTTYAGNAGGGNNAGQTAPNNTDTNYVTGVGVGGNYSPGSGGGGEVYLSW